MHPSDTVSRNGHGPPQRPAGDDRSLGARDVPASESLRPQTSILSDMSVVEITTAIGNTTVAAARIDAQTAVDVAPALIGATTLPDDSADLERALSAYGQRFVHDSTTVASELVRTLAPGGVFAVYHWAPVEAVQVVMAALRDADRPPDTPGTQWSEPDQVRALFTAHDVALEFESGSVCWVFPTPEDGVAWLEQVCGPILAVKASLTARHWHACRDRLTAWLAQQAGDADGGAWVTVQYLLTSGQVPRRHS